MDTPLTSWLTLTIICITGLLVSNTAMAACAATPANDGTETLVVMQTYDEYEPGMPRIIRQITVNGDGTGQASRLEDGTLKTITTFSHHGLDNAALNVLNTSKRTYFLASEMDPDLIVEGNPKTVQFIVLTPSSLKLIDGHEGAMPTALETVKNEIENMAASSTSTGESGVYLMARILGDTETREVLEETQPTTMDALDVSRINSLSKAMAHPFVYTVVPVEEVDRIQDRLKLKKPGEDFIYLKETGHIYEIRIYQMN